MTVIEIICFAFSVVSCIGAICAIIAFIISRKKDNYQKGADDKKIVDDIEHIKNFFDDLRLDVKEISRKQDQQSERIARVEESLKSAHRRIDQLEHSLEGR